MRPVTKKKFAPWIAKNFILNPFFIFTPSPSLPSNGKHQSKFLKIAPNLFRFPSISRRLNPSNFYPPLEEKTKLRRYLKEKRYTSNMKGGIVEESFNFLNAEEVEVEHRSAEEVIQEVRFKVLSFYRLILCVKCWYIAMSLVCP